MPPKPKRATGYPPDAAARIQQACVRVADELGDLMDEFVVIGGMVPQLLAEVQTPAPEQVYIGTLDLDISLALHDGSRHKAIAGLLRERFEPDENERGNPTLQRWRVGPRGGEVVLVDFMTPLSGGPDRAGKIRTLDREFGAIEVPGLTLAFKDNIRVPLLREGAAAGAPPRQITVCGHGAFIVLKALALVHRDPPHEPKDAYDIYYSLRHLPRGMEEAEARLRLLLGDPHVDEALDVLDAGFGTADAIDALHVAEFLTDGPNDDLQAEASGFVRTLRDRVRAGGPAT